MKWIDIVIKTVVFITAFIGVFYLIPNKIIPDVIEEFKKVFRKQPVEKIEVIAGYKGKKRLWDTRSTFDIKG